MTNESDQPLHPFPILTYYLHSMTSPILIREEKQQVEGKTRAKPTSEGKGGSQKASAKETVKKEQQQARR